MNNTVVGYYPTFQLPSWFAGPNALIQLLTDLWNCHYHDLYEDVPPGHTPCPVSDAYSQITAVLWSEGDAIGHQRLLYLGWACALASQPTVNGWASADDRPKRVLAAVQHSLEQSPEITIGDWRAMFPQIVTPPQALHEALDVYQNLMRIVVDPQAAREAAYEILEDCMEGYAVFPGADGRRDLFNWLLVTVVPAAWSCRLPEAIYTFKWPWPPKLEENPQQSP